MRKKIIAMALALVLALSLCPAVSAAYEEMTVSDDCVGYIKQFEGFQPKVYNDGTGYYIGYGCACGENDYPEGISEEDAEALLRQKMEGFASGVNSFLKKYDVSVTQNQFDALCSLAYNLGTSWLDVSNRLPSYLVNGIENYTDSEIMNAFAAWCHIGEDVIEGLVRRRVIEGKMFLYGDYSGDTSDWYWLILDANGGSLSSDVYCFKAGSVYGAVPAAEREGFTFAGWQKADGVLLSETAVAAANMSVSAVWTEGEETIEPAEPTEQDPAVLSDITTGAWYYSYVSRLYAAGVVSGFPDGTFRPEENVTNAQALKLILLSAGYPEQERVEDEHWAKCYLDYAVKKKFLSEGDMQELDGSISRNAIADLTAKALELDTGAGKTNPFTDTTRGSVLALYEAGIIEGYEENGLVYFKGANNITRAEICAILTRVADYVEKTLILYGSHRIPINYDLPFAAYDSSLFTTDERGRLRYDGSELDVSYGIDVSYWQGDIDWTRVAADGVDFVMIRAGYRGMTSGKISMDEKFEEYISGAKSAGLKVGIYFFSQAISVAEAKEEANWVISAVSKYDIDFPVAFDWEPLSSSGSRTKTFDGAVVTQCAIAYCDVIAEAGYTPVVYYNKNMAYLTYDLTKLTGYDVWLAQYSAAPDFKYDFQMLQYGSSGQVNGIPGRVDMNICFKDFTPDAAN